MSSEDNIKARVLVVDDEPFFLELLSDALSPHFHISLAKTGDQGIKIAQGPTRPDLILLDIIMPDMDGYETCRKLKEMPVTREIPLIFLTAKQDIEDELKGFQLGAIDYITKPISIPVVLTRVRTQLAVAQQRLALEHLVQERTEDLERTKDAIIYGMGEMAEMRDKETGNHLIRTREYVRALALKMAKLPKYRSELNERLINAYQRAAPLHDIGKIAVPDSILQKPGPLDNTEWQVMKQHPGIGKQTIENAEKKIGSTLFIQVAKDIAYSHHEKWDGSGYPEGLEKNNIPLSARLMAIADVYDALISKRCYKEAIPHDDSVQMILQQRGVHFDPDVVDCFEQLEQTFKTISDTYKDH